MLVTNLTDSTFVLAAGVILRADEETTVDDDAYLADSTLNQHLDNLEAEGLVTIAAKPADTFPSGSTTITLSVSHGAATPSTTFTVDVTALASLYWMTASGSLWRVVLRVLVGSILPVCRLGCDQNVLLRHSNSNRRSMGQFQQLQPSDGVLEAEDGHLTRGQLNC